MSDLYDVGFFDGIAAVRSNWWATLWTGYVIMQQAFLIVLHRYAGTRAKT
ncbi:MAG: hypothetical protein VX223_05490 [Myxococcota bacterium]|nr:hypothetical protein [Myxococcota bacterium]